MEKITKETTLKEKNRMINSGMIELSKQELINILDSLGYKIDFKNCFDYINNLNEIHYRAKSISIIDKKTGLSFANIDATKSNLKELQSIRINNFVFNNGKIWEL